MKGNDKLIDALNSLLARELTAINQYMVESEMQENWGYGKLHALEFKRSITEMKHAERLIERILFLDGQPIVNRLEDIRIGSDIPKMIDSDLNLEYDAVRRYNEAVKLAAEVGDNSTKTVLEAILNDEIAHVDELEAQRDQIEQMGIQNFLSIATDE